MTEDSEFEQGYQAGEAAAARAMLRAMAPYLPSHPDRKQLSWELERAEALAALRTVCRDHGDNEWPDNLHLADIIEKHLGRHLDTPKGD